MALTEDQKKNLLIGGGVGALALAVGFVIFGGKAAAAPAPVFQSPQRGQFPQRFQPSQGIPTRGLERTRKKRRHDDDNERGNRGNRGEDGERGNRELGNRDRGENGRGEYSSKRHRRHRRDD